MMRKLFTLALALILAAGCIGALAEGKPYEGVTIQVSLNTPSDAVREAYESYAAQHNRTATYFVRQVRQASDQILDHAEPSETSVAQTEELIAASAIVSGFARLFAEKLTLLDDKTLENGGNIAIE